MKLLEQLLRLLLKSPARPHILNWIVDALEANRGKNQLGRHAAQQQHRSLSSDGFMLNLSHALIRLLKPHDLLAVDKLAQLSTVRPAGIDWSTFSLLTPPSLASDPSSSSAPLLTPIESQPLPNALFWVTLLCAHEGVASAVETFEMYQEHIGRIITDLRESAHRGPLHAMADRDRAQALTEHQAPPSLMLHRHSLPLIFFSISAVRTP